MGLTCHSEVGKIDTVFIKNAANAFIDDTHIAGQWKTLNYLSKPSFKNSVEEYNAFQSIIQQHAQKVLQLPSATNVTMDSIYCRDASIATNKGMIICNMGKAARANEPAAEQAAFVANNIPVLGVIKAPGTVEGGDVAWLDENTLAVGYTYRTNKEGIAQLKALLEPIGVNVLVATLPHYKGPSDVFHLMSILSPVDVNLVVVYSPLMPIAFREELLLRKYTLIEVPDDEFDSMGCNVLALAPRKCLMVKGNQKTKAMLEASSCEVFIYDGEDISVKGGGGPTCLTRPIWRQV